MKAEKMVIQDKKEIFMASKIELDLFKELEALKKEMNFENISDVIKELLMQYEIRS